MASTIAHDAHNIVVVGADDGDMARAVQRIAEIGGGIVVIESRGVQEGPCRSPASLGCPVGRGRRGQRSLPRSGERARLHLSLAFPDNGISGAR